MTNIFPFGEATKDSHRSRCLPSNPDLLGQPIPINWEDEKPVLNARQKRQQKREAQRRQEERLLGSVGKRKRELQEQRQAIAESLRQPFYEVRAKIRELMASLRYLESEVELLPLDEARMLINYFDKRQRRVDADLQSFRKELNDACWKHLFSLPDDEVDYKTRQQHWEGDLRKPERRLEKLWRLVQRRRRELIRLLKGMKERQAVSDQVLENDGYSLWLNGATPHILSIEQRDGEAVEAHYIPVARRSVRLPPVKHRERLYACTGPDDCPEHERMPVDEEGDDIRAELVPGAPRGFGTTTIRESYTLKRLNGCWKQVRVVVAG